MSRFTREQARRLLLLFDAGGVVLTQTSVRAYLHAFNQGMLSGGWPRPRVHAVRTASVTASKVSSSLTARKGVA